VKKGIHHKNHKKDKRHKAEVCVFCLELFCVNLFLVFTLFDLTLCVLLRVFRILRAQAELL
jgi:hypothetical protein